MLPNQFKNIVICFIKYRYFVRSQKTECRLNISPLSKATVEIFSKATIFVEYHSNAKNQYVII